MPADKLTHRFVETNGIRMHCVEAGVGPLVVLLHGFPESWHAWRHQFGPIAAAGYRSVARTRDRETRRRRPLSVSNESHMLEFVIDQSVPGTK